jgi:hypothetical protein
MKRLAELFAVILPVCLGLGLIYLCAMGRMEPMAALSVILAIALIVPLAASLARQARDEALYRSDDRLPELARR